MALKYIKWDSFLATFMSSVSILSNFMPLLPASAHSDELACLKLSGPDSIKFLQGQTSCDFNLLTQEQGLQGAICNIKGRVIANFYALQQDDDILLILASDMLEDILNHLKKFAVFFKTQLINAKDEYQIEYVFSQGMLNTEQETVYACLTIEQTHSLLTISQAEINQSLYIRPTSENRSAQLPALNDQVKGLSFISGQAIINKATSEKFIPQMLNMQLTQGISFKKGCYTGQEIVARMQYRGNLKKHLYLLSAPIPLALPALSKLINQEGKEVAEVVSSVTLGEQSLIYAVIGDESAQMPLFFLDTELALEPLPYT
jgi:folate-binding protein YgfZ